MINVELFKLLNNVNYYPQTQEMQLKFSDPKK